MSGSSRPAAGASARTFAFSFTQARVSVQDGRSLVTGPDGTAYDVTGVATLVFADGTIQEQDGAPLVDDLFYYAQNLDVWAAHVATGLDADTHYSLFGWHEGRDPDAYFSTNGYLAANPDVRAAGVDPLVHYDIFGWHEGRDPSTAFSTNGYLAANPDVAAAGVDPLAHFLTFGGLEGRHAVPAGFPPPPPPPNIAPDGLDYNFYLSAYPDVAASGINADLHFQAYGAGEGRNPNAYFDTRGYLATYTDVAAAGVNPLLHYHLFGWHEGRDPGPAFDGDAYLAANPDVAAAGIDPLLHFLIFGLREGRAALARPLVDADGTADLALEGAGTGTATGVTASWGGWISPNLSYALTADSSGGGFRIDAVTGQITVADGARLDYETSGPSHAYTVTVVAQDGGFSIARTLTIAVGDANDNAPVFASDASGSEAENTAAANVVYTAQASDADGTPANNTVRYGLAGTDAALFTVDAATGAVRFKAPPNFEAPDDANHDNIYDLTVTASDGTFTTSRAVAITVTDVNAAPVVTSAASGSVAEAAAPATIVYQASASDDGENGAGLTYSLSGGADDALFTIDAATGAVRFTAAPNFEAPADTGGDNVYDIRVVASDGALATAKAVAITVTDRPPGTPADADAAPNTVHGNAAVGTYTGLTATAADPAGGAVAYALVDQNGNAADGGGRFQIDAATGAVTATGAPIVFDPAVPANNAVGLTVRAADASGAASYQGFVVTIVNAPPQVGAGATLAYAENQAATAIDAGLTVSDTDNATLVSARVAITGGFAGGQDVLGFTNQNGIAGSYDPATGVLSLAGSASLADYQTALRSVTYANTSDDPSTAARTISFTVNDGSSDSAAAASTITLTPINDAPTATGLTQSLTINEDAAATKLFTSAPIVADVDSASVTATLTLSDAAAGVLTGAGAGAASGGGLVYTISGTPAAVSAALAAVQFDSADNVNGATSVGVTISDGLSGPQGTNPSGTVTITVNPVNDAPVASADAYSVGEDGSLTGAAPGLLANDSDVEGDPLSAVLVAGPAHGTLTLNSNGSFFYTPNADYSGTDSFTYKANDGAADSNVATVSLTVNPVNDAPSGTDKTVTTLEDTAYTFAAADFGFTDPRDTPANSLQAVRIATLPAAGTLTDNGVAVVAGQAVSAADIQAGLLRFTPAADGNGAGYASFTFRVQDDGGTANGGSNTDPTSRTITLDVTPVNDAPVLSGIGPAHAASTEQVFARLDSGATVSDVELDALNDYSGALVYVTRATNFLATPNNDDEFAIDSAGASFTYTPIGVGTGDLSVGGVTFAHFDGTGGTGSLSFLAGATTALVNEAIDRLSYRNANDTPPASIDLAYTFTDGNAGSQGLGGNGGDTRFLTVDITPLNDAPTTANHTINPALDTTLLEDGAYAFQLSDFPFADALEGNALQNVIITALPTAGSLTLNGVAVTANLVVAASEIAAGHLVFTPAADGNGAGYASFGFKVQDDGGTVGGGQDTSAAATMTLNVTAVNDAPSGADATITAVGAHTFAAADFGFTDPVDAASAAGPDALAAVLITSLPTTGTLTDNGNPVAPGDRITLSDIAGGLLVFTPAGNASASFTFQVQDTGGTANGGVDTDQSANTITLVQNAPPVVTASHSFAYIENQGAAAFDPAITVTDADSPNLVSARVQITGNYVQGEDVLAFTDIGNIHAGVFDAATGTLTLTGSDTPANYQSALRSVTYQNTSDNPSAAARTITIIANDGAVDSAPATDTITVTPVNDAPTVTAGHTLAYAENQAATAIDPTIAVTDPDSTMLSGATVQITGNYVNGEDRLAFAPLGNITGSFDVAAGTLTLSGLDTLANYEAALRAVTYQNTGDDPSGATRTVTFTATDSSGAPSVGATGSITVTPVNDPPTLTATGATATFTENGPNVDLFSGVSVSTIEAGQSLDQLVLTVTNVSGTGGDSLFVDGTTVALTNGNAQNTLTNATTASVSLSGSTATVTVSKVGGLSAAAMQALIDGLAYANASDNPDAATHVVTIASLRDTGGTTSGGLDTATPNIAASITVTPVNDAPTVSVGAVNGFSEPANGTPAASAAPVAIAPNLTVSDADSGNLTGATFVLNNLKPSDALSVAGQAGTSGDIGNIHFSIGSTASTETITFTGTDSVANYNAALHQVQFVNTSENPDAAARSYTIKVVDDGGTANGGQNTGTATASQTVTAVNDAPVATVPTNNSVGTAFSHTDLAISGLSVADVDAAGGNVTATISSGHAALSFNTAGLSGSTGIGSHTVTLTGTVAQVNAALATLTYNSDDGFTGSDTVSLSVNDNGNTGTPGAQVSNTASFQVGVVPQVFVIDNTPAGAGNAGTLADPYSSILSFNNNAADGSGDYVYINAGTYAETDGINLVSGEHLYGQGQTLQFINPVTNAVVVIGTGSAGNTPTISVQGASQHGIDLAQDNEVRGLNVATTAANQTGISDNGGSVTSAALGATLTIADVDVTGSGQAVNITHGGNLAVAIDTLSSSGGAYGVQLGGALTGSFAGTTGTLSGHGTSEFDVNGGAGTISYGGTVNDGTGLSASIAGRTGGSVTLSGTINDGADAGGGITVSGGSGGTVTFSGATKTLNTGASNAVNLTSNSGATIDFTGSGLDIDTTSGNGFSATGGGTVTVQGIGNTLTSTTGTALNVANTIIGASDLTFRSITSNGGSANGIILDTTGSLGGLHVTGNGNAAAHDGGTIANKTGADGSTSTGSGIYLNSTSDVQLNNMLLQNFQNFGIRGVGVNGFTLANSTVNTTGGSNGTNTGTPFNEGSVSFANLTGTASITNSTIANGIGAGTQIVNTSGTLGLTVTGSTFSNNGIQGLLLTAGQNAGDAPIINASIATSTFSGNTARDVMVVANGAGAFNVNIGHQGVAGSGGTFNSSAAAAVDIAHNSTANSSFNVENATFTQVVAGVPINIFNGSASGSGTVFQGRIVGNSITGLNNSGFDGITLTNSGPGNMTALVDSNTITNVAGVGINYGGAQNSASNTANLTITNNLLTMPDPNASFGIQVSAQASSTASATVNATITGNNVVNDTASPDYRVDARFANAVLQLPGYTGGATDTTAVRNFVAANNKTNGATSTAAEVSASTGIGSVGQFTNTPGGAPTPLPTNPQPLLASSGGVQASSPTPGEMHLAQAELDSVVAAAIGQWALAGASPAQLAALHATVFTVADLSGAAVGDETAGHIRIDIDAAGHGWFVDPTPNDNFEFTHAADPAGIDLFTDPSNAAAGHLDLLTTVMHEMGHVLGLPDSATPGDLHDLMHINLADGERRLPSHDDVVQAAAAGAVQAEAALPPAAQAAPGTTVIAGTAANDTIDAGHGGSILFGGAGADTFAFGSGIDLTAPTPPALTHVADYSAAQGDVLDFSGLYASLASNPSMADTLTLRVVEDAGGHFATLQAEVATAQTGPHWVSVAQLDGMQAGDAVTVVLDPAHHAVQLQAGHLLV